MTRKFFSGFPLKAEVTPIPNLFFAAVMPQIESIAELKTVLHIFWTLSRRKGYPRFVTYSELKSDPVLISGIGRGANSEDERLCQALHLAVNHGILLHLGLDRGEKHEDVYFINTEAEKKVIEKVQLGELSLLGLLAGKEDKAENVSLSDIFSLYEQNIGMITPMIAEELKEAEKLYPADWIESAFREAVSSNKRSWKYIARILERWVTEGRDNGKLGRGSKEEREYDKYLKGRYGHMVKH